MKSVMRILVLSVVAIIVTGLTWWQLSSDIDRRTIRELEAKNVEMAQRLEARQAMIDRLSRSRRIGHVNVLKQTAARDGSIFETTVRFIELDSDGRELGRQTFTVPGDVLFIDALTIKFAPNAVAAGDPFMAGTLVLLRRVYSDRMPPIEGFAIDTPGAIPPGYAATDVAIFEKRLWDNFWQLATDADLARRMGVRVAQGEAVYKQVIMGQTYELIADASGGISLTPIETNVAAARDDASK